MNLALNPFEKGRKPEKVDEVKLDDRVMKLFKKSKSLIDRMYSVNDQCAEMKAIKQLYQLAIQRSPCLTKNQVEIFLERLWQEGYDLDLALTEFYSWVIYYSYDGGCNDFSFTFDKPLYGLMRNFFAKEERRLKFTFNGDVGNAFGEKSRNCDFVIKGEAGQELGTRAHNCYFKADRIGWDFARDAVECIFEFNSLNMDEMITVNIYQIPKDCIFKVRDKKSKDYLESLCKNHSRVVLI
ncbi:hypothetical protein KY330_05830 [Candidatus Woesearchaeota archaeon]|nr:hypothetical protein [Candidatus Woesearchaeota archaeon]